MKTTRNITTVAIYARSAMRDGRAIAAQLGRCREYAGARGWKIVGEHCDEGISGITLRRPGLDRLLAQARSGQADALLVRGWDRLSRSAGQFHQLLDELATLDVVIIDVSSGTEVRPRSGTTLLEMIEGPELKAIRSARAE